MTDKKTFPLSAMDTDRESEVQAFFDVLDKTGCVKFFHRFSLFQMLNSKMLTGNNLLRFKERIVNKNYGALFTECLTHPKIEFSIINNAQEKINKSLLFILNNIEEEKIFNTFEVNKTYLDETVHTLDFELIVDEDGPIFTVCLMKSRFDTLKINEKGEISYGDCTFVRVLDYLVVELFY